MSDVDVAIELIRKNPDFERARGQNQRRAEELANLGRGFRNVLEWEGCWYWEAFRFLKGRSRVIALADFNAEKTFVLAVPHRFLIGEPDHGRCRCRRPRASQRLGGGARATVRSERPTLVARL